MKIFGLRAVVMRAGSPYLIDCKKAAVDCSGVRLLGGLFVEVEGSLRSCVRQSIDRRRAFWLRLRRRFELRDLAVASG